MWLQHRSFTAGPGRAFLFVLLAAACREPTAPSPPPAGPGERPSPPAHAPRTVLLVSLDTTRTDALSCYADDTVDPQPVTPTLHRLCREGVRFQHAFTPSPTTLSAHASVMTGLDPHGHRVVRNGYPLEEPVPVLAERFQEAGWSTRAVVAAMALDASMGLDRGFEVYEDHDLSGGTAVPANRVRESVLTVLSETDPSRDLFLFVHFYDPHTPWVSAPASVLRTFADPRYQGPVDGSMDSIRTLRDQVAVSAAQPADIRQARALYQAEVAFADYNLGLLLAALSRAGRMENALVAVFADHGETLHESTGQAYGHGADVDLFDLHVPLLFWGHGAFSLAPSEPEPVARLQDLPATLLDLAGLGTTWGDGRSLRGTFDGDADTAAGPGIQLAEACMPQRKEAVDAWNNLPFARALVDGAYLLQQAPAWEERTEQVVSLETGEPASPPEPWRLRARTRLEAWAASAPPHRPLDMASEMEESLRALGYLE